MPVRFLLKSSRVRLSTYAVMRAAFWTWREKVHRSSEPTTPALSGGGSSLGVTFIEPGVDGAGAARRPAATPRRRGGVRSARCSAAPRSSRSGGIAAELSRHEPRAHRAVLFLASPGTAFSFHWMRMRAAMMVPPMRTGLLWSDNCCAAQHEPSVNLGIWTRETKPNPTDA
jgi:hypothetical protein